MTQCPYCEEYAMPPEWAAQRAELIAIHAALMNPQSVVPDAADGYTLALAKQFILKALEASK